MGHSKPEKFDGDDLPRDHSDLQKMFFLWGPHGRVDSVFEWVPNEGTYIGIESLLSSMILGTWTTFEALAGDLWEVALNANPKWAMLKGRPKRIRVLAGDGKSGGDQSSRNDQEKRVPLREMQRITKGRFDLSEKMGTLLRGRYKFTTLRGIREAYAAAFDDNSDAIDQVLADKSLNALSCVRNVLVHKAGVVDEDYVMQSKNAPLAPQLSLGESIEVNGVLVSSLVSPAIQKCIDLLKAVDTKMAGARK